MHVIRARTARVQIRSVQGMRALRKIGQLSLHPRRWLCVCGGCLRDVLVEDMSDHVFLVCGFGRCGSSLVMQMLEAGGFPVTGKWPAFEDDIVMQGAPAARWASMIGKAVKSIDTHVFPPPISIKYRAILMTRDHQQQAKSTAKFTRVVNGLEIGRAGRRRLAESYRKDSPAMLATLHDLCGDKGWSSLSFERLLADPFGSAVQIAQNATGEARPNLDISAMTRAVRSREPHCLPGMLEADLLRVRR